MPLTAVSFPLQPWWKWTPFALELRCLNYTNNISPYHALLATKSLPTSTCWWGMGGWTVGPLGRFDPMWPSVPTDGFRTFWILYVLINLGVCGGLPALEISCHLVWQHGLSKGEGPPIAGAQEAFVWIGQGQPGEGRDEERCKNTRKQKIWSWFDSLVLPTLLG